MKKRILAIIIVLSLSLLLSASAFATSQNSGYYGEYATFKELYDAYFEAIEDGDAEKVDYLLELADYGLQKEIQDAEATAAKRRIDPDTEYYNRLFMKHFTRGSWVQGSGGISL